MQKLRDREVQQAAQGLQEWRPGRLTPHLMGTENVPAAPVAAVQSPRDEGLWSHVALLC